MKTLIMLSMLLGLTTNVSARGPLMTFDMSASVDSWSDENEEAAAILRINQYAQSRCEDQVQRISDYKMSRTCYQRPYGDEYVDYCKTTVKATYKCHILY